MRLLDHSTPIEIVHHSDGTAGPHPRYCLDSSLAAQLLGYMRQGRCVEAKFEATIVDHFFTVTVDALTDGEFLWGEADVRRLEKDAQSPGSEFVEHAANKEFTMGTLSSEVLEEARQYLEKINREVIAAEPTMH